MYWTSIFLVKDSLVCMTCYFMLVWVMLFWKACPIIIIIIIIIAIFREEATSALAGFHACPLSRSNWNLEMLVFLEGGKPENPEKNPRGRARTNNKLNPHMALGRNRTWATLVGGEHSHHCAIPAPPRHPCSPTCTMVLLKVTVHE